MTARVVLYGRPGCHLCEDALVVLERVRGRTPFTLEQVDIESTIDKREMFELFVDEQALEAAIAGT
jgi:hypothetical protein